jgi:DNA gyrase subunit B
MTDADVDGSHIRTLIVTFIYRYMKKLLEDGHVYIALPPLFKNIIGKKEYYTYSDDEQMKFLKKNSGKITNIQRYKGLGEMDAEQLWSTTMNPETRTLVQLQIDNDYSTDETICLLMGDKVEPRRDFINENAKNATIDI